MTKTWHTLPIPTRLVISYDATDGTLRYERRAVIAFTIGDNDNLTLFTFESATRVFWWSGRDFVSAWMSD